MLIAFLLCLGVFVGLHVLVAGTRLRDGLILRLGETAYHALFSLGSVASLATAGWFFAQVHYGPEDAILWEMSLATRRVCQFVTFLAVLLVISGVLTPGPTAFEPGPIAPGSARGILRVTRRPVLWGLLLWAVAHLLANGELVTVILFGSLAAMTAFGLPSSDRKTARREGWSDYARQTSNIPFAAVLSGRNRIVLREMAWKLLAAGLACAGIVHLHPLLIGVPAWP